MSTVASPNSLLIPQVLTEVIADLFHACLIALIADVSALSPVHGPSFLSMIIRILISQKPPVALHSFYFESQ